jgi:diguanylate cyclase (GGDEF)-like protein
MTSPLDILPPSLEPSMADLISPHDSALSTLAPAPLLENFGPVVAEERRKRAVDGAKNLITILNLGEAIEKSKIDPVTGLRNREAFDEEMPSIFSRKEAGELTILYFDLNGLNRVNKDSPKKHQDGDAYLGASSNAVATGLRPTDIVYRVGGDEFAAVLDGKFSEEELKVLVERLTSRAEESVAELGLSKDLYTGLSIGGAIKEHSEDLQNFIARADDACEKVKRRTYRDILDNEGVYLGR